MHERSRLNMKIKLTASVFFPQKVFSFSINKNWACKQHYLLLLHYFQWRIMLFPGSWQCTLMTISSLWEFPSCGSDLYLDSMESHHHRYKGPGADWSRDSSLLGENPKNRVELGGGESCAPKQRLEGNIILDHVHSILFFFKKGN